MVSMANSGYCSLFEKKSYTFTIYFTILRSKLEPTTYVCYLRYEYGRSGNPTRDVLEKCIASLDGAKHCMTFASGLAAPTAITPSLFFVCFRFVYHTDLHVLGVAKALAEGK